MELRPAILPKSRCNKLEQNHGLQPKLLHFTTLLHSFKFIVCLSNPHVQRGSAGLPQPSGTRYPAVGAEGVPSITCTRTNSNGAEAILVHELGHVSGVQNGNNNGVNRSAGRSDHPTPAKMPKRPRAKSSSHAHGDNPLLGIDVLNQVSRRAA